MPRTNDEIYHEMQSDALSSLRWRVAFGSWMVLAWSGEYRLIFNSMNVELSLPVKALLALGNIWDDGWMLLLPLAWVGWRAAEDRWIRGASPRRIRGIGRAVFALVLLALYTLHSPMIRLINNVG